MDFLCFGCTANFKEKELLENKVKKIAKELLKNKKVNKKDLSNIVFLVSCAVKSPTENKIIKIAEKLREKGKKVIITGCLALAYPEKLKNKGFNLIGENFLDEKELKELIIKTIGDTNFNHVLTNKKFKDEKKERLTTTGKEREIIEVSRGCLGCCSYCITKKAIPSFYSYSIRDIIKIIDKVYKKGKKEILLTAQDLGAFGLDNKENIVDLIKKINEWWFQLKNRRKNFFIRIGMMNANFIKENIEEILEEIEKGPFYKFIHLPLQSGSNEILKKMKRKYSVEEWIKTAKTINKYGFTLATDIIVGYPGEKEEDFNESLKIVEKVDISVLNISKFWPRPKTEAYLEWKKEKIDDKIIKERVKMLKNKFEEKLEKINRKYLKKQMDKEIRVLFNEYDEKRKSLKGKDEYYKQIIIKEDKSQRNLKELLWEVKKVKLVNCHLNNFFGILN